jgi:hypothetical protein
MRSITFCLTLLSTTIFAQVTDFRNTDFKRADSIAAAHYGHSIKDLPLLSYRLTSSLSTEQEKFRAIYKWVCENIDNDYGMYDRNRRKREKLTDPESLKKWNHEFSAEVFKALADKKKTVCTGYAYLIKELSLHAGLNAIMIDGYGRTVEANVGGKGVLNHTWNAVNLNGKWYLCDATWSAGVNYPATFQFIRIYDDAYFLADPRLFVQKHYPRDPTWLLLDSERTLDQFLNAPIYYSDAIPAGLDIITPDKFNLTISKGEPIVFHLKTQNDSQINTVDVQVGVQNQLKTYSLVVNQHEDKSYSFRHMFNRKGKQVLHILLNKKPVASYSVIVK